MYLYADTDENKSILSRKNKCGKDIKPHMT